MTPGTLIRGVKHVTWDDTYLRFDQAGQVMFASSLIGETLGQLAAWNVMAYHGFTLRPVAGIVASARLLRTVHPGETLLLESVIDDLDETAVRYHSVASVGHDPVFTVEGAIGPLLPMTNFIDIEVVRRQFNEINRPGDWDKAVEETSKNIKNAVEVIIPSDHSPEASYAAAMSGGSDSTSCGLFVGSRKADLNTKSRINSPFKFDHIEVIEPGLHWTAEKLVSRAAPYFADHFPNNPVLPMTILLECKLNLAHEFVAQLVDQAGIRSTFNIVELRKIKMNEFIHPGDVLVSQLKLKYRSEQELVLSAQSFVDGKRVCIVEIVLVVADL